MATNWLRLKEPFETDEKVRRGGVPPVMRGENHPLWRGGRYFDGKYMRVLAPQSAHADRRGYVREHVLVVERALGRALPKGAEVHHLNGDRTDNRNENLVLCPSRAYHMLLEVRQRAFAETGSYAARYCRYCRRYSLSETMLTDRRGYSYHRRQGGRCAD